MVHIQRDQQDIRPHPRGGESGFAPGMTAADHNNIIFFHITAMNSPSKTIFL